MQAVRVVPSSVACVVLLVAGVCFGGEPAPAAGEGGKSGESKAGQKADQNASKTKADAKPPKHLSRVDIEEAIAHDVDAIAQCYKRYAVKQNKASGDLRIELVIHRRGYVKFVEVVAPGVRGKKLDRCVRKFAEGWSFPERRYFTTTAIPFFFLKTEAKGAGPMHSCWSAKGCPTRRRAVRKRNRRGGRQ